MQCKIQSKGISKRFKAFKPIGWAIPRRGWKQIPTDNILERKTFENYAIFEKSRKVEASQATTENQQG
ncbi:ribosomal protein L11 methyltransferase [Prevotella dentalis DSM 3688]|uniref:Ribosomal protein L11 methyltransferase n=1 Tax=Prevotella dentalis (strain ATCC 49559 / DSM 3688 / JCM 13448 / NCTC 12043 / ES 2772) TaxID=908937 RepID=F9D307_PREDD|nr:ribosomal protein L11 methyltransferase [Prevotella dentalis DSM 3688]